MNYSDIEPKINLNENRFKIIKKNNNQYENKNTQYVNKNFERLFENLLKLTNELNEKINILDKKFDEKMDNFEKKLLNIENSINNNNNNNKILNVNEDLKELVLENINIDRNEVLKAMTYRDYRSLTYLFKLYYKNELNYKNVYPIRLNSIRKFEYYANNKWNTDLYGDYSRNILLKNFENLFIKYNDIDAKDISQEDFLLNQHFICKLMDEKKKKELFKSIIEEIKITSSIDNK